LALFAGLNGLAPVNARTFSDHRRETHRKAANRARQDVEFLHFRDAWDGQCAAVALPPHCKAEIAFPNGNFAEKCARLHALAAFPVAGRALNALDA
jgi:hypothetical protein